MSTSSYEDHHQHLQDELKRLILLLRLAMLRSKKTDFNEYKGLLISDNPNCKVFELFYFIILKTKKIFFNIYYLIKVLESKKKKIRMLKVDIFVNPRFLYFPTSRYFWDMHWFPVRFFRKEIKKSGIDIRFKSWRSFSYDKMGDIICFSSYFFFNHKRVPYPMKDATQHKHRIGPFKCLEELKKREKKIIWFDMWDGPEALADAVLDYVDKY